MSLFENLAQMYSIILESLWSVRSRFRSHGGYHHCKCRKEILIVPYWTIKKILKMMLKKDWTRWRILVRSIVFQGLMVSTTSFTLVMVVVMVMSVLVLASVRMFVFQSSFVVVAAVDASFVSMLMSKSSVVLVAIPQFTFVVVSMVDSSFVVVAVVKTSFVEATMVESSFVVMAMAVTATTSSLTTKSRSVGNYCQYNHSKQTLCEWEKIGFNSTFLGNFYWAKTSSLLCIVLFTINFKLSNLTHGFLYYTRTDFMPFETLKKRPNSFNVL